MTETDSSAECVGIAVLFELFSPSVSHSLLAGRVETYSPDTDRAGNSSIYLSLFVSIPDDAKILLDVELTNCILDLQYDLMRKLICTQFYTSICTYLECGFFAL